MIKVLEDGTQVIDKNMCTNVDSCSGNNLLPISNVGWERKQTSSGSFSSLRLALYCGAAAGCVKSPVTDLRMNSFRFALTDSINPTMQLGDSAFISGLWVRQNQLMNFTAQDDQSGFYRTTLDSSLGTIVTSEPDPRCSTYTSSLPDISGTNGRRIQPCPTEEEIAGSEIINTRLLPDGQRSYSLCSEDFSGNKTCRAFTGRVDNSPPTATTTPNPNNVGPRFQMTTEAEDSVSGIARVEYRIGLSSDPIGTVTSTPVCVDQVAPYSCQFDLAGYENGDSLMVYVTIFDLAGNELGNPYFGSNGGGMIVDKSLPVLSFTQKPPVITNSPIANFSFSSDKTMSGYTCSLDGAAPSPCSSPLEYLGLSDGDHSLVVVGTDSLGNVSDPIEWQWTIDTVAPEVEITLGPDPETYFPSASFEFESDDPTAVFECRLDGGSWTACSSPGEYLDLTAGNHTFEVRATDLAGNKGPSASWSWEVILDPPTIDITSGPAAITYTPEATFAFESDQPETVFECRLDGGAWASCSSPAEYVGLTYGPHLFEVRGTGPGGKISDPVSWGWTIESEPTVEIESGPAKETNSPDATFVIVPSDPLASMECRLDLGAWVPCSSPKEYIELSPGDHRFDVRASNAEGTGPVSSWYWTIDTISPELEITSGPSNGAEINDPQPTWEFSSNDPTASFRCRYGSGWRSESTPVWNPWVACDEGSFSVGPLVEGKYTIEIVAEDPAGNTATKYREILVDLTAPEVEITSGPSPITTATQAAFAFSSPEDPEVTYECQIDDQPWQACTSPELYGPLGDGDHVFRVRGTDQAGNTSEPVSWSWQVQASLPTVEITSGPSSPTTSSEASFAWIVSGSSSGVECRLDGTTWESCSSPKSYSGLGNGNHIFEVRALGINGSPGPTDVWVWQVAATLPTVQINSHPGAKTNRSDASFSFSSPEDNSGFQCRLNRGVWVECSSPTTYGGLSDGSNLFEVRALSLAGEPGPSEAFSWLIDTKNRQCKISYLRSRLFVYSKKNAIRLVARYKSYDAGTAVISFHERGKNNRVGKQIGRLNARFAKSSQKISQIRVPLKRSASTMKRLRKSKRGFYALVSVKNSPGYCQKAFYSKLKLSDRRIVDRQKVWFQQGTFK